MALDPATSVASGGASVEVGTSLPASPDDGDLFRLTDSLTVPTYSWLLQYSAAMVKWVFIGGSPKVVQVATSESTASGSWVALTTPVSFTTPYAGVYDVVHGANIDKSTTANADGQAGPSVNNADPAAGDLIEVFGNTTTRTVASVAGVARVTVGTAGHTISQRYRAFTGTCGFQWRFLRITPLTLTP